MEEMREAFKISIHAPREGSDTQANPAGRSSLFQSTLPAWVATLGRRGNGIDLTLSIPLSHGERGRQRKFIKSPLPVGEGAPKAG